MDFLPWIATAAGIVFLFAGGEGLVRGAVGLAGGLGVPPLVVGLTVVGFGTSAPELVVSLGAALDGAPDLAVGNVIGSNIANILLILGVSAAITPLAVQSRVFRRDGVVMLAAFVALVALAQTGEVARWAGVLLVAGLAAFLGHAFVSGRRDAAEAAAYAAEAEELAEAGMSLRRALVYTAVGIVILVAGAELLVTGATDIARAFGVPEAVIGLTLVAVGTSLPELATSVVAALRKHTDVAVGNVVGSNIFNVFGILGVTAVVSPLPVAGRLASVDVWVMLGIGLAAMVALRTGWRVSRPEGLVALVLYAVYTGWLLA
jgi:cation:H+ antiporter